MLINYANILEMCVYVNNWLDADDRKRDLGLDVEIESSLDDEKSNGVKCILFQFNFCVKLIRL